MINEVIPALRVIKMYAWEKHFLNLIQLYRKMEMKYFRQTSYLRAFNVTLFYVSSKLMIFPTLVVFVLLKNELTPDKVQFSTCRVFFLRHISFFFLPLGFLNCRSFQQHTNIYANILFYSDSNDIRDKSVHKAH